MIGTPTPEPLPMPSQVPIHEQSPTRPVEPTAPELEEFHKLTNATALQNDPAAILMMKEPRAIIAQEKAKETASVQTSKTEADNKSGLGKLPLFAIIGFVLASLKKFLGPIWGGSDKTPMTSVT